MRSAEIKKVNVLEMKCLRSLIGVLRMDRVRNAEVRRRTGIERVLASRADQSVLRWFGYVERMDEYRMASRVLIAEVSGGRGISEGLGVSPYCFMSFLSSTYNFKLILDMLTIKGYKFIPTCFDHVETGQNEFVSL